MRQTDRREFLYIAGRSLPIVIGVPLLVSCTEDAQSPDDVIVATSTVNSGHSHTAEMPADDIFLTEAESYESSLESGHTHMIQFTPGDFLTLRDDGEVVIESSTDSGHSHSFTFQTA